MKLQTSMFASRVAAFSAGMGGISVALLAVGAHFGSLEQQSLINRGAEIQLIHSVLVILIVHLLQNPRWVASIFLFGVIFFSGSLYGKAFLGWPTTLAPWGGSALILGWFVFGFRILREK